jgi:hypothetical protein
MKARKCTRCKGTGQARYNHLNGDTHCYLCNGTGVAITYSAAEKAQQEADRAWATEAYYKLVGGYHCYENKIRRPVREASEETGTSRRELERRLTWWVKEGLMAATQEAGEARTAAEAQAVREFKAVAA